MPRKISTITLLLVTSAALSTAIDNGIGLRPPMGWRSWNSFGGAIDQTIMTSIVNRMTEKIRTGRNGNPTSLADLGYLNCGIDDNWQECWSPLGVNGSFHTRNGDPIIARDQFPSLKNLTDYGHSKGLKMGWYMNNCICKETNFHDEIYIEKHMQKSAEAVALNGFDSVKLDGCGQFRNLTWWAKLLNETGRPIMIENCHWGQTVPGQTDGDAPCTGLGFPSDCPYNFFRTSFDIKATFNSMFANLQSVAKFGGDPPLSRPGSWAYPDMLEVGRLLTSAEDRTHFAAWCIVSAPLILGYDLNDIAMTEHLWPIIGNEDAIKVNQAWAGHPGRLVKSWDPAGPLGPNGIVLQIWSKPLEENNDLAILIINNTTEVEYTVFVNFTDYGIAPSTSVTIYDIYQHRDVASGVAANFTTDMIKPHDCRFLILKPE
eukprot:TRINITY_DN28110_c0_g1_i1.p1 TRINITY_DN28110_c0_g1~~TRINITY_DN28110_c0_g1_i1.p1  ORF type:complete len:430 (+),score=32.88 TRINITY_DN28110_c0_g1_i1:54-1343(+)